MFISYIMPLNPEVWLPHLEFMLQTISVLYPQYPNDVTKKNIMILFKICLYFFLIIQLEKNLLKCLINIQ